MNVKLRSFFFHWCLIIIFNTAFIKLRKGQRLSLSDLRQREGPNDYSGGIFEVRDEGRDRERQQCPLISFDSIIAATGNFSRSNLLGKGGFGPVYKVSIPFP